MLLDKIHTDLLPAIIVGIISSIVLFVGTRILLIPINYIKILSKKRVEREYKEFLELQSSRELLTMMFFDKIARSLSVLALWAVGIIFLLSPIFSRVTFELRYFWISSISIFMALGIITALSKPVNSLYDIKNPDKYKARVKKKLGRLPDEAG